MARRSSNLAGLAALGALGYMALRGGKQAPAPVEDRSRYVNRAGDAVTSDLAMGEPDYSAELAEYRRRVFPAASMPTPEADAATDARVMSAAERSGLDVSPGELAAMSGPAVRPAMAATARPAASSSTAAAYRDASRKKDVLSPTRAGVVGYGRTGGRRAEEAQALSRIPMRGTNYEQSPQPSTQRPPTREELISQIPTGGTPTVSGGDRVSGNEFTRNVGNILTGMGPATLAGFGKVGAEMATARGAAQRAADARAATKAAEGREAVTNPMAWMAGPKGMKKMQAAEDAERKTRRAMEARKNPKQAVKGEESDVTGGAIGYKKGGFAKAKPKKMASGGMTSKVSSASKRADGIATKGKTKCKIY